MATILVLEDEIGVRELFALVLRREGHVVLEAHTAKDAERISRAHEIDALIANVVLPGNKRGTEFASELRKSHPHVRVLLISGWPQRREDVDGPAGAPSDSVRVLEKPFGIDELIRQVRSLLSGRGAA